MRGGFAVDLGSRRYEDLADKGVEDLAPEEPVALGWRNGALEELTVVVVGDNPAVALVCEGDDEGVVVAASRCKPDEASVVEAEERRHVVGPVLVMAGLGGMGATSSALGGVGRRAIAVRHKRNNLAEVAREKPVQTKLQALRGEALALAVVPRHVAPVHHNVRVLVREPPKVSA